MTTTNDINNNWIKTSLACLMLGIMLYFLFNSCNPKTEYKVYTHTQQDSIENAKADSLRNDSLRKAGNDTIRKNSLNVITDIDTVQKK